MGVSLGRLAVLLMGLAASVPAVAAPPKGGGVSGPALADIGPAPEAALTDQAGRPFALSGLRGRAVVVSFVYTTCTGTCPATTFGLSRVQSALRKAGLWGERVHFVSITLDPARDTPEALARYARIYDADADAWHFLSGPPEHVAKVINAWGMWAKTLPSGVIDHPSRIFLVDPAGRLREIYSLETLRPTAVVQDITEVLAESATGRPSR
jgi:protein SCO1/2